MRSTSGWSSSAAQPAHTQRRVRLVGGRQEVQRLVRAGVQHPHDDTALGERLQHRAVRRDLLLLGRRLLAVVQEEELGTEQPDALGARPRPPPARRRDRRRWPAAAPCDRRRWHPDRSTAASAALRGGRGALQLGALLGARLDEDLTGAAVDGHDRALGDLTGAGQRHDGRHPERPREDRAVAGRPALLGDETEHQRGVQQRRVGGSQVTRDQHVRLVAVRHARHRHAEQPGDDPVPHVVEVGDPPRQVLPGAGQQRPVRGERVVHAALGGAADGDTPLDVGHQLGVLRHHGLGLEHGLCLAARQIAARDQVGRHSFHGLAGAPLFALGLFRGNLLGRRLQHRRTHVPNLADRHTVAHADASQRCLHFTRLRLCGGSRRRGGCPTWPSG